MELFVVRQFFEDCNDNQTLGVYSTFGKAMEECTTNTEVNNWGGHNYSFRVLDPWEPNELWCEVQYKNTVHAYYSIEKLELDK